MCDEIHVCDNCQSRWQEEDLSEIHDFWGRIQPGAILPSGECPECGALCYPADAEEQVGAQADVAGITAFLQTLTELVEWQRQMGGFDATIWRKAEELIAPKRKEHDSGEGPWNTEEEVHRSLTHKEN